MSYIKVPDDKFTVISGSYYFYNSNINKTINYYSQTDYSVNFAQSIIDNYKQYVSNNTGNTYLFNNYLTFDSTNDYNCSILYKSGGNNTVNYWMYPMFTEHKFTSTFNLPLTKTISIIINSNTLPIYYISSPITIDVYYDNTNHTITIPSGNQTWSSVNEIFYNLLNTGTNIYVDYVTQYRNIQYFRYMRMIPPVTTDKTLYVLSNPEFDKYYGLLHMIITYKTVPRINERQFSTNMTPVYRSLHIPANTYTANDLVNYINNNNTDQYNINDNNGIEYTLFKAKIVNNDIIIYTDDGTQFFINPICQLNEYQETSYASEHKLCSIQTSTLNYTNTTYTYYINDSVNITPTITGNYDKFSATGLPDGLEINPLNGVISGVINVSNLTGDYLVDVDNAGEIIHLTISVINTIEITELSYPNIYSYINVSINVQPTYTGEVTSFAITSGELPTGLVLDSTTGVISGVCQYLTSATVTITASNSLGSKSTSVNIYIRPRKYDIILQDNIIGYE